MNAPVKVLRKSPCPNVRPDPGFESHQGPGPSQLKHIVETAFTRFRERGLDGEQVRARSLVILAQMAGAIVMSRACPDDSSLADDILTSCRNAIMASLPD